MPALSTDSAHGDGSPDRRRIVAGRFVRVILPIAAAAALAASYVAGDLGTAYELRAVAPPEVTPGEHLAVRAVVFIAGDAHANDAPVDAEVRAFLSAPTFRTEPVRLRDSRVLGVEGELAVPFDAPASASLIVEATMPDGAVARARRRVRIREDAARARSRTPPRTDLETFALGPTRPEGDALAPEELDVEMLSRGCVPELPCTFSVRTWPWMDVEVVPSPQVELLARRERWFTVVVRGPEGALELVASRGGAVVARRDVRLPLVPGGVAIEHLQIPGAESGSLERVIASLDDGPLAVDFFHADRWVGATSIEVHDGRAEPVPWPPDWAAGVHRMQVQRHLFTPESADRAGVMVYVGDRWGQGGELVPASDVLAPPPVFTGVSITEAERERARTRRRLLGGSVALGAGVLSAGLLFADRRRRALGSGAAGRAEVVAHALLLLAAFGAVAALAWLGR